ncbi:hypothetical protein BaRGS_00033804, partial [Batillaria attramentaria]
VRVFRPFFVSLNLPYSVIRGEHVVLQAIVFNYMQQDQDVRVTLAQSQDFYNLEVDAGGQEDLRREDKQINVHVRKSVYFPIVPTTVGHVELIVSAQTQQAADAVRRNLKVEAEGVPKEYNVGVLLDLKNTTSFSRDVNLTLPPNVVSDSELRCDEPQYQRAGQSTEDAHRMWGAEHAGNGARRVRDALPDRHQPTDRRHRRHGRQLYGTRLPNGADIPTHGRIFQYLGRQGPVRQHVAEPYIQIDVEVIARAVDWLVARQNYDGSFPEYGIVHDRLLQGGAARGPGLTAFVLISLLENNAQVKALDYLKQQLPSITDTYVLAIVSYALALAGDPASTSALARLESKAVVEGKMKYWRGPATSLPVNTGYYWQRPYSGSASDVEITSYALLTYAASRNYVDGLGVMNWLDTIIALQALSEFAPLANSGDSLDVEVDVTAGSFTPHFTVTKGNALVLQSAETKTVPDSLTVSATGSGVALLQVDVFFNVEAEVEEPAFELHVNLTKDTLNLLEMEMCARWLVAGSTGMAVQEVGIPSGFEVDTESLLGPYTLKRKETENSKLVLYFDEISGIPTCVRMSMLRTRMVAKSKPVAVRVYDYYEPG